MFSYERLVAESRPVRSTITAEEAAECLHGCEIRFLSKDRPVKLPARGDLLTDALRPYAEDERRLTLAVQTLHTPSLRAPLTSLQRKSDGRSIVVASVIDEGDVQSLVVVTVGLVETKSKFQPLAGLEFGIETISDPDDIRERLEELYVTVPQPARRRLPGVDDADPLKVAWVGGVEDGVTMPFAAFDRLAAVAAVRDAELTPYKEASRWPKDVLNAVKATSPDLLVVWTPQAARCEEIRTYGDGHEEMAVLAIDSRDFEEAALELRLCLDVTSATLSEARPPPEPGDERFYIKVRGSKVGDRMVVVPDCEHGKWSDDSRQKAPRARKGIEYLEGATVTHLSKCMRCTKNRWRARF